MKVKLSGKGLADKAVKKQKKLDLEVETIGEPDIRALPEFERQAFLEILFERIKTVKDEDDKKKIKVDNHSNDI